MSSVRVRFAPSPTGDLHVGGLRTLLFNWLYAKKTGGVLVLRIEDTDRVRSTLASEKSIIDEVKLMGLGWDEGPIRQSERMSVYIDCVKKLREKNLVYPCFCTADMITQKREIALKMGKTPHYDGTCSRIDPKDADFRIQAGEKAGLRFRAPGGVIPFQDAVKGSIEFGLGAVGDFLITRAPEPSEMVSSDGVGMPVYNFCCVIDDHLMGMTHVIRGDDHLANTARQLLLYQAFDWTPPEFAHIPMVLGADRQKLSKRTGDSSVSELRKSGYLNEAVLNFLAFLGWAPKGGELKPTSGHPELLTLNEMIENFSLEGIQKAPAIFDSEKLKWMNSEWMRRLPLSRIAEAARPWFTEARKEDVLAEREKESPGFYLALIEALRTEAILLPDLELKARPFLEKELPQWGDEEKKIAEASFFPAVVNAIKSECGSEKPDWKSMQKAAVERSQVKGKDFFMSTRVALLGSTHGMDLDHAVRILGGKRVKERMDQALARVGQGN